MTPDQQSNKCPDCGHFVLAGVGHLNCGPKLCEHGNNHAERQPEKDTWLILCDDCGFQMARVHNTQDCYPEPAYDISWDGKS